MAMCLLTTDRTVCLLVAALLAFVAVGCGSSRSHAISIAHEICVSKLRADLQALAASPAGQQHEIPKTAWPESVRRFQPLSVQRHMNGMLIVFSHAEREQQGMLVMLDATEDPGSGGSGVSYDNLCEGLFWCVEKIRTP